MGETTLDTYHGQSSSFLGMPKNWCFVQQHCNQRVSSTQPIKRTRCPLFCNITNRREDTGQRKLNKQIPILIPLICYGNPKLDSVQLLLHSPQKAQEFVN